jgi:threonine aldolase
LETSSQQFASDNYAGICPEAWAALESARHGHAPAYGDDLWTARASDLLREIFETDCEVFFTFNGTAANSLALASLCQSYHSILCSQVAHVETDECGAPEFFSNGTKILLLPTDGGKIRAGSIGETVSRRQDLHFPKPRAISLTQATETGTIYQPAELGAIAEAARRYGLSVHMDGARFANAAASLGRAPREFTWEAGVDVLCFGGTKMGLPVGEAVVFFRKSLAAEFAYRCKQAGQLASKMRFLAAPWVGMLENGAWLRHAAHANAMAERLFQGLSTLPAIRVVYPRQANSVFLDLSPDVAAALRGLGWRFYNFIGDSGCRFMCAWDTEPSTVDRLLADFHRVTAAASPASTL